MVKYLFIFLVIIVSVAYFGQKEVIVEEPKIVIIPEIIEIPIEVKVIQPKLKADKSVEVNLTKEQIELWKDGKIIENTSKKGIGETRIITDVERLKNKIETIKYGQKCGQETIYFGTYLNSIEKIQKARDLFVKT